MINAIGEAIVQQTTRAALSSAVNDREIAVQKEMQARQKRPIEKTDENRSLGRQPSEEEKTDTTTRQRFEEGKIVLEKYDRRGKLVKKIPPGYLPFSEIA
ncbi:MAG: hypothetical protein WCF40_01225 [Desulfobacterales bacterium]|jgi:hypothetical protein